MIELPIKTTKRTQFIDITEELRAIVRKNSVHNGICSVFSPHTTAGLTINEHADPDVIDDLSAALDALVPHQGPYAHAEGNSAAHIKTALVGVSQNIAIENGDLRLGTWQGVFFAEFDGPRARKVWVQLHAQ